jgi:starch phosphorylase
MPRLKRCSPDSKRPVQLVFAGKAHPADRPGQEVLRHVHDVTFNTSCAIA